MKITTITNRVQKLVKNKKNREAAQTQPLVGVDIFVQRVEKKAYELYEQRGRQDGRDWDDWLEAEKLVEAEMIAGKQEVF